MSQEAVIYIREPSYVNHYVDVYVRGRDWSAGGAATLAYQIATLKNELICLCRAPAGAGSGEWGAQRGARGTERVK